MSLGSTWVSHILTVKIWSGKCYLFQIADSRVDLRRFGSSGNNPEFSITASNPRIPVSQKVKAPFLSFKNGIKEDCCVVDVTNAFNWITKLFLNYNCKIINTVKVNKDYCLSSKIFDGYWASVHLLFISTGQ